MSSNESRRGTRRVPENPVPGTTEARSEEGRYSGTPSWRGSDKVLVTLWTVIFRALEAQSYIKFYTTLQTHLVFELQNTLCLRGHTPKPPRLDRKGQYPVSQGEGEWVLYYCRRR